MRTFAEDIAQEAFVRIAAGVAACGPVREFRKYLDTIVRNLCVDHLRKSMRSDLVGREVESDESILERPTAAAVNFATKPEDVLDRAPAPEEAAIENERRRGCPKRGGVPSGESTPRGRTVLFRVLDGSGDLGKPGDFTQGGGKPFGLRPRGIAEAPGKILDKMSEKDHFPRRSHHRIHVLYIEGL